MGHSEDEIFESTVDILLKVEGAFDISPRDPKLLTSSIVSPHYASLREINPYTVERNKIVKNYIGKIRETNESNEFGIFSIETAGIPFGSMIAYALEVPFVYVRKKEKRHGSEKRVEGKIVSGMNYIGIEDVTTTGESIISASESIRTLGGEVRYVISGVDRYEGAAENLRRLNIRLLSLAKIDDRFAERAERNERFTDEEIKEFNSYRRNPLEWSRSFLEKNPEWLIRKIEDDIAHGNLSNKRAIRLVTNTHPELRDSFVPKIIDLLISKKIPSNIPEIGYEPPFVQEKIIK